MVYLVNTFSGIHGFIIADFIILLKMPARFYAMRKSTSARRFWQTHRFPQARAKFIYGNT